MIYCDLNRSTHLFLIMKFLVLNGVNVLKSGRGRSKLILGSDSSSRHDSITSWLLTRTDPLSLTINIKEIHQDYFLENQRIPSTFYCLLA